MKKKNIIIIGSSIIVMFLFVFLYKNYITKSILIGSYTNQNFDYTPFVTNIPYSTDTLRIFEDGHFSSSYWGNGEYELSKSLKGTKIRLRYNYEFGKASFNTYVERDFSGSLKIILFRDNNHYYEKLD